MNRRVVLLALAAAVLGCSAPQDPADDTAAVDETGTGSPSTIEAPYEPGAGPDDATLEQILTELRDANRLFRQARFDEALEAASRAVSIAPEFEEPYRQLSIWYTQLDRHDLALAAFEGFAKTSLHGLRYQARHSALSGDGETARSLLERCLEREDRHPGCRAERAVLQQMDGAFAAAAEDLRVAYDGAPSPDTAARLAEVLRVNGDYVEARAVVDRALEDSPEAIDLLNARARLQLRDRDYEGAEATLRGVLELDGGSHTALRMLGGLLLRLGQDEEGRYRLSQADLYRDYHTTTRTLLQDVAANRNATAALMIAELDLTIGNYPGAQRWLGVARSGGAPAARLAAAQAWTWYALGDTQKGDQELARAGGNDNGHANLARAARAVRVGDAQGAAMWIRRAVEHGPNERSFLRRAADLYTALGDQDSADELLVRAATANFP